MPPHLCYVWLAGLKCFGGSWTAQDLGDQGTLFPQGVSQDRTWVTVQVQCRLWWWLCGTAPFPFSSEGGTGESVQPRLGTAGSTPGSSPRTSGSTEFPLKCGNCCCHKGRLPLSSGHLISQWASPGPLSGPCQPRGHTKAPIVAPAPAGGEQEEPRRALTAALNSRSGLRFPPPAEPFGCEGQVFMSHGHTFRFSRCAWSRDHAQSVRGQEAERQQPGPCLKWRMEGGDGTGCAAPAVSIPCSYSECSLFQQLLGKGWLCPSSGT